MEGLSMTQAAKTIGRRELLRGGGVAALAVAGVAAIPTVGGAKTIAGDPLLAVLNRFKAVLAAFDAYTDNLDAQGKNSTWKEVKSHHRRAEAILRDAVGLSARSASSLVVLDLVIQEELLNSIYDDDFIALMKSVRAYIASTGEVWSLRTT
jgi:hypothetical protein